jgi:hypothetical protein
MNLILLFAFICTCLAQQKKLTVSIIVPTDPFRLRNVNTCINNELKALNNSNYPFLSEFKLEG